MTCETLAVVIAGNVVNDTDNAIKIYTELDGYISIVVDATLSPTRAYFDVSSFSLEQCDVEMKARFGARSKIEKLRRRNAICFDVDHLHDEQLVLQRYIRLTPTSLCANIVVAGKGVCADRDVRSLLTAAASFEAGAPVLLLRDANTVSYKPRTVLLT